MALRIIRLKFFIFKICVCVILLNSILSIAKRSHLREKPKKQRKAFLTFFTENHICEAIKNCLTYGNIKEIQTEEIYMIAFYGSDVTTETIHNYKNNCPFVHLRPLLLDMYPARVRKFKTSLLKFLAIHEILYEYDVILYTDASIHMHSNMTNGGLPKLFDSMNTKFKSSGIRLLTVAPYTNYPVTHSSMYSFFNVTIKQMIETVQLQAGAFLINNSPAGIRIITRMKLCSVNPKCIAPKTAKVHCPFSDLSKNETIVCHQFDQSALNMLLIELYGTNQAKYYNQTDDPIIKRFETC